MTPQQALYFRDRAAAGRALGAELAKQAFKADIVLGLTRGGVPVAFEVARAIGAQLDIIVVKKLGAPFSVELAIGAVCSGGTMAVRAEAVRDMGIEDEYLEREAARKSSEAHGAEARCRGGTPILDVAGRHIVIVDDGVATGATVEAAVKSARRRGAARVTVAVPVSSLYAEQALKSVADEFITLGSPEDFWAVGQFYEDFSQVEDEAALELLTRARTVPSPSAGRGTRDSGSQGEGRS